MLDRNRKQLSRGSRWSMLSLAVGVGFLLSLAGCGGGDDTANTPPAPPPAPPKPAAVAIPGREDPVAPPVGDTPTIPAAPRGPAVAVTEDNQNDAFLAFESGTNFDVLDDVAARAVALAAQETVVPPLANSTSSQFVIVEKPVTNSAVRNPQYRLPRFFVELPEHGYDSSGWPLRIRSEIDQSVMAFVPAGVFVQGKNEAGPAMGPEHSAYLDPYYIDIHEVTLENFNKYREQLTMQGERAPQAPANLGADPQHPVLGVLWRDAVSYAEFVYKTLPTEAEWEKAARGSGGFDHPWGFGRAAWHVNRRPGQITPVMSYPTDKSSYGVFDMAGNAREWCDDWFAPNAYTQAMKDAGQVPRNYRGPRKAEPQFHRVIKGDSSNWNVWMRSSGSMSDRLPDVGFRGVLRMTPAK